MNSSDKFLFGLLCHLTGLRVDGGDHLSIDMVDYCLGYLFAGDESGVITWDERKRLTDLVFSAMHYAKKPFPCRANAGPQIPFMVALKRQEESEVLVNVQPEQIPQPAAPSELSLLCVLVSDGFAYRTYPAKTVRRLSPALDKPTKWEMDRYPNCFMRKASTKRPTAQVLARCLPVSRQANALHSAGGVL